MADTPPGLRDTTVNLNVLVPMRDGISLSADVYLPVIPQ